MKRLVMSLAWVIACVVSMAEQGKVVTLTVLCDSNVADDRCQSAEGFSCLVRGFEDTLLFNTGARWDVLESNAAVLKQDLAAVDAVVLSHHQRDQIGGLFGLLDRHRGLDVYLVFSSPQDVFFQIEEKLGNPIPVGIRRSICRGAHTTGELGYRIKEQALVFEAPAGLIVLTGCAHPGLLTMVSKARDIWDRNVFLVVGEFHMLDFTDAHIADVIQGLKALGVAYVAPAQCSGDRAQTLFRRHFGDRCLHIGAGSILRIPREPAPQITVLTSGMVR